MMIYSAANLVRRFGERTVLNVDRLEVEKGYIYALLGPNGSGKTTLLNIMGFLDQPTSGEMRFREREVNFQERTLHKLRQSVVMVQQNPILFSTSVYKNLEFGLKIRNIPVRLRQRVIEESLDLVGMRHLINDPAHKLSGGETQRVVLARALALSPEVILCDEPTASVDLENQVTITRLLKDINAEKGITLVFTSHDENQAASLPHFKLFLEQGRISDISYENTFPASITPLSDQQSCCRILNELELNIAREAEGLCRLKIEPCRIKLSRLFEEELPQNCVEGRVQKVSEDVRGINIGLDCGVSLTALISNAEYRELNLLVGDSVRIKIPPEAVSVLDYRN